VAISKNGIKVLEALMITHLALETAFVRLGMLAEDVCTAAHIFDFEAPQELGQKIYRTVRKPAKCSNGKSGC
jgi:Mn-dependent DtxR family transcriptional regulator